MVVVVVGRRVTGLWRRASANFGWNFALCTPLGKPALGAVLDCPFWQDAGRVGASLWLAARCAWSRRMEYAALARSYNSTP